MPRFSSIENIARVIWLGRYSEDNLMALLYAAYFDVSGEPEGHPVMSVGGVVAPVKKWKRFEMEWNKALTAENIKEFHATDFAAREGAFKGWSDDRRRHFFRVLKGIIKHNINKLLAASMEIDAWNEVNQEYFLAENYKSPYAMCSCTLIRELRKWAKRKKITSPLEYIFEDGDDGWDGLVELCKREHVVPIRLPKAKAIPCQAADLIAWKNRIAAINSLRKLNKIQSASGPDWDNLLELFSELDSLKTVMGLRPSKPGIYGKDALIRSCKQSGIPTRKALGF